MEDFYVYVLQVNVGLAAFYLLYRVLFARDTFLKVRRFFLLVILCLAFLYPAVPLAEWLRDKQPLPVILVDYTGFIVNAVQVQPEEKPAFFTVENVLLLVWLSGTAMLAVRLLVQLWSVFRLRFAGNRQQILNTPVITLSGETAPFSFFQWIFVNPAYYAEKELEEILTHEKEHVAQLHSWDMLAGEMLCIFFWFNPAVWLIRFEIRQNLEFLADRGVLASGYDRKNYQYHLLRLSNQSAAAQIINNFNVSQLKKRIMMMNKKKASKLGLIKYAMLLPVTGCLILASNGRTVAEVTHEVIAHSKVITETRQAVNADTGMPAEDSVKQWVVKGVVVNASGDPLPLVTVSAIGKKIKTAVTTNQQGEFAIQVSEAVEKLSFAHPDMQPQYRSVKPGESDLKIVLGVPEKQSSVVVTSRRSDSGPDSRIQEEVFTVVGGNGAASKFVARNIVYPNSAAVKGVEGTKTVSFVIGKAGDVTESMVVKAADEVLESGAVVVSTMATGKQSGTPVAVKSGIDIAFKSAGNENTAVTLSQVQSDKNATSEYFVTSSENLEVVPEQISKELYTNAVRLVTPGKEIVLLDGKLVKDKKEIPENLDNVKGINIIKDQQVVRKYVKKYRVEGEIVVLIDTK